MKAESGRMKGKKPWLVIVIRAREAKRKDEGQIRKGKKAAGERRTIGSRKQSDGWDALCSLFADREAGQGRKQCEDESEDKSRRVAAGQIVNEPARVGSESAA